MCNGICFKSIKAYLRRSFNKCFKSAGLQIELINIAGRFKLEIAEIMHNVQNNGNFLDHTTSSIARVGQNAPGAEKPQQCCKYFLQCSTLLPEELLFEQGGAKPFSCPGCNLTSVHPCTVHTTENFEPTTRQKKTFSVESSY